MRQRIQKTLQSRFVLYLFAAGTATLVDISMYFVAYNFIFEKGSVQLGKYILSAPSLALVISYSCGLLVNFSLSKFLVFRESEVKTHKQFFRFVMVAICVFIANYYLLNFLVHILNWFPTMARAVSALLIGVLSYLSHKAFSFNTSSVHAKKKKGDERLEKSKAPAQAS